MTESIIIFYKPISLIPIINNQSLIVTIDELFGISTLAFALQNIHYDINIQLSNGDYIDIPSIKNLPYFNNIIYPYTLEFFSLNNENYLISFNNQEFITGCIKLCILLGLNPSSYIINIKYQNTPLFIDFYRYYGKFEIPNFTKYPNGHIIHTRLLSNILNPKIVDNMRKLFINCFPNGDNTGIFLPSNIYFISSMNDYMKIITILFAGQIPSKSPITYRITTVCTDINERNQGLAKSLLIATLNDLIAKGIFHFSLDVFQDNITAYKIYTSLGFRKTGTSFHDNKSIDVLSLDITT